MKIKLLNLAILVFFIPVLMQGCAKDVGQDRVQDIAYTLEDAANFLTSQGLSILNEERPELIPDVRRDLESIVDTAEKYEDGVISVADVADTITDVLRRLNARFGFLPERQASLIEDSIDFLSRQVSRYLTRTTIPDEAAVYIRHLAAGIRLGLQ